MKKLILIAVLALSAPVFAAKHDTVMGVGKAVVWSFPKHVVMDSYALSHGIVSDVYLGTKYVVVAPFKAVGHVSKQIWHIVK